VKATQLHKSPTESTCYCTFRGGDIRLNFLHSRWLVHHWLMPVGRPGMSSYNQMKSSPLHQRINGSYRLKHTPNQNKWDYTILVYFDNNKLMWNGNQICMCFYDNCWAWLRYSSADNLPLIGREFPEVHLYDIGPSTRHHSEDKQAGETEPIE
jgi:hypothetical protein